MLKVHTSDGKTHRIDLSDATQAEEWISKLKRRDFQETITGVSVVQDCLGRIRCPVCKRAGHLSCESCGRPIPNDSHTKTGVQYSLSRPDGYGAVAYSIARIEPAPDSKTRGGERVDCFAGDTRATMMVHSGQPSVRVTLLRTGKRRYTPNDG